MRAGFRVALIGAVAALALLIPSVASAATPGKIAFVSDRDGNDEIWVMNADGSGQAQLTNTPSDVINNDPAWSPDGKQIAFLSDRDNSAADEKDLFVMNADGSSLRQLTFNDVDEFSVDWSPDGTRFVYDNTQNGENSLYLLNVDGSGLTPLLTTTTNNGFYGSHWSPDGTTIVFADDTVSPKSPLRLISPTGSLIGGPFAPFDSFAPDWTADGKRIVFYAGDIDADSDTEIAAVNPDGTGLQQLTLTGGGVSGSDVAPSPSRDGLNRIAFVSRRDADVNREIFVMNADGTGVTQLTQTGVGVQNRGPDWQPTAVCRGKVARIVGTAAAETLTGGPGADVISGQGGNDTINGLDGKDTICGDAGKDKLNGGKGKDLLSGGKGNDKLNGGKGKDTCIGGKGKKDTAKKCEKLKKIP